MRLDRNNIKTKRNFDSLVEMLLVTSYFQIYLHNIFLIQDETIIYYIVICCLHIDGKINHNFTVIIFKIENIFDHILKGQISHAPGFA